MKVLKIFGKIIGILVSIVFFFVLIGIMTLSFAKNIVNQDFYSNIAKNIDLKEIKLSDFDETLEDINLEEAAIKGLVEVGIEEEKAIELIESEEIKEYIGGLVGNIVNYSLTGENKPEIKKEDAQKILEKLDISIPEEEIDSIITEVNSSLEIDIDTEENVVSKEVVDFFNFLNSNTFVIYSVVIIVAFYLIVSLLTWSLIRPLKYLGIPTILSGLFLLLIPGIIKLLVNNVSVGIGVVISNMINPLLMKAVIIIVIGILMIILYAIINKIKHIEENKKEDIPVLPDTVSELEVEETIESEEDVVTEELNEEQLTEENDK